MGSPVTDNAERSRFELKFDETVAFIDYRRRGAVLVLTHAEVPADARDRGIGARLTAGALELIRARGERIEARCPYVAQFIERNTRYRDLLAGR